MSKQTEALKLALETAEGIASCDWRKWEELASPEEFERWVKSRALHMATALREALAEQPAQRTWVGLTDEEKSDLWCESTGRDCVNEDTHVFADAIEAKLREKNA